MLRPSDVFDVYAINVMLPKLVALSGAEDCITLCEDRVNSVWQTYVTAGRARIKAEAKFLGLDLDGDNFTIKMLLDSIGQLMTKTMEKESESMMRGGGFNMMGNILKAHQAGGQDLSDIDTKSFGVGKAEKPKPKPGVDPDWFKGSERTHGGMTNDPLWHEIAKAFVKLEEAVSMNDKFLAIDRLNDLQHNSFHLLIDLQSGRMLEGQSDTEVDHGEAVNVVKEVLDIKAQAKTPQEFLDRCSPEIRKVWARNRAFLRS